MPKLLKNNCIVDDSRQILAKDYAGDLPEGPCFVPLDYWLANKSELLGKADIGVWLDADQEPESLNDDCTQLTHIAVNFPTFMDGRGFSIARLIRERYHFSGELRAIGQVVPDQLYYLTRCGFDAFCTDALDLDDELLKQENLQDAGFEEQLNTFSVTYQACVKQPQPLFQRR